MSASSRLTRVAGVGKPDASFYPSPFFDIAQNYIPRTLRETFPWCAYYQQSAPLIATVTSRLSAYPVTDIFYPEGDDVAKPLKDFFAEKNLRVFLVECLLDRVTFGNAFVTVARPFIKKLACPACKDWRPVSAWTYSWRECNFYGTCPKCERQGKLDVFDDYIRNPAKVRLIRWPAESITPDYNVVTGNLEWYYALPDSMRADIKLGVKKVIENTPQMYIDAVRLNFIVKLLPERLFHMRRPSISRMAADSVLGCPLILPVLKDMFLLQVLKKSQEVICMEHIIPMRAFYPEIRSDGGNIYQYVNIQNWQSEMQAHIQRWKQDPNYMPVSSTPIGYQSIGGQGKAYLLNPDIRMYNEIIVAGMGIPISFVYGDAHYSGASVNLKALENEFLGMREDLLRLVQWLHKEVASYMDYAYVEPALRPFRMADDLQRMSFDSQLVAQKMKSRKTFMSSMDLNVEQEDENIREETSRQLAEQRENMITQAHTNAQVAVIQAHAQVAANGVMSAAGMGPLGAAPPGAEQGMPTDPSMQPGMDPNAPPEMPPDQAAYAAQQGEAKGLAGQLAKMDTVDRYNELEKLRATNPQLAGMIDFELHKGGVDMNPLPQQRASKRT